MNNNNQSIEQVFDNSTFPNIIKVKQSPFISILELISGILLILLYRSFTSSTSDSLVQFTIVLAIVLLVVGAASLVFRKTNYVDTDTKKKIKFSYIYFDLKEKSKLVKIVEQGNLDDLKTVSKSIHDGIKLRVAGAGDGSFCVIQVVTYASFENENTTEVKLITQKDALEIYKLKK